MGLGFVGKFEKKSANFKEILRKFNEIYVIKEIWV
jgi:hypothetical protein